MSPTGFIRSLGRRLHEFAAARDPDSLRAAFFRIMLVVSGLASLNGLVHPVTWAWREKSLPFIRGAYGGWALVHVVLYWLSRRRPRAAYVLFLSGVFFVLTFTFHHLTLPPREVLGLAFAYHAGVLCLALLVLSFSYYAAYSAATTIGWLVFAFLSARAEPSGTFVGYATPLGGLWLICLGAAYLMDRHRSLTRESREELVRNMEHLEEEVRRRTKIIEEQQQHLRQVEKMRAVGQLAEGIAHDFNNMLAGILGYANVLKLSAKAGDEVYEAADVIERSALRAADLTGQLLGFARKGKLRHAPVDMHRLIGEVCALLARTIDRRITLVQRLRALPPVVLGDPGQLHQVVLNLVLNARDAMPEGGELSLETDATEVPEGDSPLRFALSPGRYVRIAVRDTGVGIPEEIQDRIFDPFFTTKEHGTGMGLATVHGIVHNHGGTVRVESRPGAGSTFEVFLPASEKPAPPEEGSVAGPIVRGSGRVLVVDDEETVREVVSAMLERLGYDCLPAVSGAEAIDLYRKHGDKIDLVLLDMTMPGMSGRECFRKLKEIDPDVRAILATGHAMEGTLQEMMGEGLLGGLRKPYSLVQLSRLIAKTIRPQRSR